MSESVGEVFVRVRPDAANFRSEASGPISSAGRDLGKAFAAAFAIGGAAKTIEGIVHAATEHQAAFAVLEQTTKDAGASNEIYGKTIESLLEKEARLKGFSDEDLASSFVRLVSATKDSKQAFDDLGIAENVARARHIDLANAALAISKAEQGSATALQRLGVVVHPVTAAVDALKTKRENATIAGAKFTEQEKQIWSQSLLTAAAQDKEATRLEVLSTLRQRFGGDAAKFASTASGQFDRVRQDFHQLEVAAGADFLGALAGASEGLGAFFTRAAESGRVRADFQQFADAVKGGLSDVKDVVETVGPPLLVVARDAAEVAKAVGAPAILTAVAAYKTLSIVQVALASETGLYARAQAVLSGAKLADSSATGKQTAAIVANTAALNAQAAALATNTTETVADMAAQDALGASLAATGAEAGALGAEFAAVAPAAGAGVAATQLEIAGLDESLLVTQLRIDGLGAAFETLPLTAGAAIAATEAELAGLGETAAVVGAEVGAVEGGGLLAGAGALGLAAIGGAAGAAIIGVAGLAAGIVYLASRETETTRVTNQLAGAVQGLANISNQLPTDRLSVAEDRLAVRRDQAALATTNLAHNSAGYQQLLLNLTSDTINLEQAQQRLVDDLGSAADAFDKTKQKVDDLTQSVIQGSRVRALAEATGSGIPLPQAQRQVEATGFEQGIQRVIDTSKHLRPVLLHDLQLLEQFSAVYGKVPTQKQINLILNNKDATLTLDNLVREIQGLPPLAAAAAEAAGNAVSQNFNAAVLAGADEFGLGPSISEKFALLPSQVGPSAAAAGSELGGVFSSAFAAAASLEATIQADVTAGQQARQAFLAATNPLRQSIASDKTDLEQLSQDRADAVTQGVQQLADAVQQAKTNLNTIGQDLAQSLRDFIEKPLNDEQAKISAAQNRLSLLGDKTTLQNLRGEVLLPGGKSLSQDPTKAIAQLQALEKSTKSPALQNFIQQYQAAALQEKSDQLASKQAVAQAIEQRASTQLANLTDLFNQGKLSQQALERDVTAILRKQGLTPKTARERGAAFADTVAGQLTGLDQQASAIHSVPQAGSGLIPSIVRPIDTLTATQKTLAGIASQERAKQLDETKKQTQLLQKIAGEDAANKALGSLDHNPGDKTKRGVDLVGTGG